MTQPGQARPEPSKSPSGRLRPVRGASTGRDGRAAERTEARFDPTSWRGALIVMVALGALLWVIEIINAAANYRLDRYGLRPRQLDGLEGIVTSPFLHASFGHLLANTAPFVLIGWVVLLAGVRAFVVTSALIIVVGGLLTWLIAPSGLVVGASGLVMGWLGYLLARAYFSRRITWIIVAIAVVFFFGGLLGGLLPSVNSDVSWQGHVAGFASGIVAGWVLHPRRRKSKARAARKLDAGGPVSPTGQSGPQPQALS